MRKYICEMHDYAIKELERNRRWIANVIKYGEDKSDFIDLLERLDGNLYDVIYEIEKAKECGIKMEGRLSKYRTAIEDLGFERQ